MPIRALGSRGPITATLNSFYLNPGNWTAVFDSSALAVHISYYEIYRISASGGPNGSTISIYVNNDLVSVSPAGQGSANAWQPPIPHELTLGDVVHVCWNSSSGSAPTATAFLRYDTLNG